MRELLKTVLSLSLSGALLVLILRGCKPLFKNRLSKRWQYYIWLVVVVRMLLPFTPETTLMGSVFRHWNNLPPETTLSAPAEKNEQSDLTDSEVMAKGDASATPPEKTVSLPISHTLSAAYENLWMLWAAVSVGLLIRKITVYQGFVQFVKAGRVEVADIELLNMLAEAGETVGVKRQVELYRNPLVSSPMLLGFFRPYIVLPSTELDQRELTHILRHELIHLKRLDMFYKWLVQITVCLHWFNPFAYLLAKEANKDCELSCDEAMIRTMGMEEKKAYGDTLLNALKVAGDSKNKLAAVTLTEGAEQLKERLDAIMRFQKKGKLSAVVALTLTAAFCLSATAVGAYTKPVKQPPATPWEVMGATGQPYTYSQRGYYQGEYIIWLGWNLTAAGESAYGDKAKLTLSDQSTVTVSFDESSKSKARDGDFLAALKTLVERLKKENANSQNPLLTPLVAGVDHVGDKNLLGLAEEYYTEGQMTSFSAIFPVLEPATQKDYCTKMIKDGKNAYLSACAGSMSGELLAYCAEKTYQEEQIALFSCVAPRLTETQRQEWTAKASRDGKNTFLAVLKKANTNPQNPQGTGSTKNIPTREESLTASFAPFRTYGLSYDGKKDRAFFNGQEVKAFVDIREMTSGGAYSFDLGYIEADSDSSLYLMAVRDGKGALTGIQKMPEEIKKDLYEESSAEEKFSEDQGNLAKNLLSSDSYIIFDGTGTLKNDSITATDLIDSADIPKEVTDRIATYEKRGRKSFVQTIERDGKTDKWVYCSSKNRMAWKMSSDGAVLKIELTTNAPEQIPGATLIHLQAPEATWDKLQIKLLY